MKFSIVTPSFNQGKYIEQTIKSVVEQQGNFDIEYFVMDEVQLIILLISCKNIQNYSAIIKESSFWQSKDKVNQMPSIKALKSTGDICAFINSDDYYEKISLNISPKLSNNSPKKMAYRSQSYCQ